MKSYLLAALMVVTSFGGAAVKTENITYKQGDTELQGYLAYDDNMKDKRPGVLVVPEWWGLNEYPKSRAEQLAKLGYVAFAADMYGKGKVTEDPKQAGQWAGELRGNRQLMRERALAALDELKKNQRVDSSKIAAIGYCFGGTTVLELARGGADLAGVVSFHGGLDSAPGMEAKTVKPKVLVLHGADDPMATETQVSAFQKEMKSAKADWQTIIYSGAVHGFTNPKNGAGALGGAVAYNEKADKRSWQAMQDFFAEIFGSNVKDSVH
jgi:dienelactone hydrolase